MLRKELEQSNFSLFYEVDQNIVGFLKLNINDAQTETKVMHIWKYNAFTLMKHFKGVEEDNYLSILAIDQAIKFGKSKIWLGVWEHNPKA